MMKRFHKILSFAFAILILVSTFLFVSYSIRNVKHECHGNDCPICYELSVVNDVVRHKKTVSIVALLVIFLILSDAICSYKSNFKRKNLSLISLKVELLN